MGKGLEAQKTLLKNVGERPEFVDGYVVLGLWPNCLATGVRISFCFPNHY